MKAHHGEIWAINALAARDPAERAVGRHSGGGGDFGVVLLLNNEELAQAGYIAG